MCEQGVAPYVAQSASKVNFNVGATMIIEPIIPNDPVVGDTANIRPTPSLLETGGTARNQMNSPNKALQVTAHKAAPNLNADVGIKREII